MLRTYYRTSYSYNAGLLGADHFEDTLEGAQAFEENYKKHFADCEKNFTTYKITKRTALFGLVSKVVSVEKINDWCEN